MVENLIAGAIDMHVHAAPDVLPRRNTDLELARMYQKAGLAGFVSKSHQEDTTARAKMLREIYPKFKAYGGVVLNNSVGGINPDAVDVVARMGGKVVWFPTVDSANDRIYRAKHNNNDFVNGNVSEVKTPSLNILQNGHLLPQVDQILSIIVKYNLVLCTGHISAPESLALMKAARAKGITRLVATHPSYPLNFIPLDEQKELVHLGAKIEHPAYELVYNIIPWSEFFQQVHELGAQNVIISSDLGQKDGPAPVEGLKEVAERMLNDGHFNRDQIKQMFARNQETLLQ